jgi:hypothetical protein
VSSHKSRERGTEFQPTRFNVFDQAGMLVHDQGRTEFTAAEAAELAAADDGRQVGPASDQAAEVDAAIRLQNEREGTTMPPIQGYVSANLQTMSGVFGEPGRSSPPAEFNVRWALDGGTVLHDLKLDRVAPAEQHAWHISGWSPAAVDQVIGVAARAGRLGGVTEPHGQRGRVTVSILPAAAVVPRADILALLQYNWRDEETDHADAVLAAGADPDARYLVTWEYDVELPSDHQDGTSPEDAAREALRIQRKPDSLATVFTVMNRATGVVTEVDLNPEAN